MTKTQKIAVTILLNSRHTGRPRLALGIFDAIDENQAIGMMYAAYDKEDRENYSINCIAAQKVED
jgi:hypothetical protein